MISAAEMNMVMADATYSAFVFITGLVIGAVIGFILASTIGEKPFFKLPAIRVLLWITTVLFVLAASQGLMVGVLTTGSAWMAALATMMCTYMSNTGNGSSKKKN